ncbi:hypothetical protein QTP86_004586 [Hemibagrus guttatus]|nr:hypothetical protein QTP86_004586 [Hemibagrus guttatus]
MESLSGIYRGAVPDMETDSVTGDVGSVQGVSFSVDPVLDGILMDSFCQQQGWMRVYVVLVLIETGIVLRQG